MHRFGLLNTQIHALYVSGLLCRMLCLYGQRQFLSVGLLIELYWIPDTNSKILNRGRRGAKKRSTDIRQPLLLSVISFGYMKDVFATVYM